ncbi:NAD(P)-dependent alcohol dehydrogenase [Companilactobacillus ginsenosidimutans]|uniref:Aryl-alcohol dehydrogenase n=1 Tax=Companilactobacillus ginsenosidimutans TaxID=1007676 RepID=A0A0H4QHD8_9LACO|nr:NAD(P)-dependent alcohol dehydrogenase [Companilactobacillus ginsenosidimutans]AKP67372.1 aryl-alcohol dehydrogenase [Companilactobacillus ginsenosidimutans]
MSNQIKAAVLEELNGEFKLETLNLAPELAPHEVKIHIVASGICHTDEAVRNGQGGDYPFPGVVGHEGSGIIEEIGTAVRSCKPGDHVILCYDYDGYCKNCLNGRPAACLNWNALNMEGVNGDGGTPFSKLDGTPVHNFFNQSAFSTETIVDDRNITVIDDDIDLRKVGPLGCGFVTGSGTVFNGLKPEVGSSLVIFGTGAVGLGALMAGKISGCSKLICVDVVPSRLETAKEIGADYTINSKEEDAVARIREITGGGADYAIDTTGISPVMQQAFDSLTSGGKVAPLAVTRHEFKIEHPFADLTAYEKSVIGVLMGDAVPQKSIPQLIEFWKDGKFPFDKLEKFYKFDEINQANADSASGKVIKPVLIIDEDYTV